MGLRLKNTDVFAATNLVLFALMCVFVYYGRYVKYGIVGNLAEFLLYAAVILAMVVVGWRYLRRVDFPNSVLLLMQAGILAHFAGGFVPVNGGRLYDVVVLGIPFDKFVHALNAFAGAAMVACLLDPPKAHPHLKTLFILMTVQGGGSIVEIVEYLAKLNVPNTGVGDYDNNMQDLVGNFVGATLFLAGRSLLGFRASWRPKPA